MRIFFFCRCGREVEAIVDFATIGPAGRAVEHRSYARCDGCGARASVSVKVKIRWPATEPKTKPKISAGDLLGLDSASRADAQLGELLALSQAPAMPDYYPRDAEPGPRDSRGWPVVSVDCDRCGRNVRACDCEARL